MQIIGVILGLLIGGVCAWWATQSHERKVSRSIIGDLESKVRFSQGESASIKEKMAVMKGEMVTLKRHLEEERKVGSEQLARMGETFKKGILVLGVSYFCVGLSLGGVASWFTATAQRDAKNARENLELMVEARLAQDKVSLYEDQYENAAGELEIARIQLHEKRVENEILKTKLRILLESLSPTKGVEGFTLNYQRLQKNLKENATSEQGLQREFPMLSLPSL